MMKPRKMAKMGVENTAAKSSTHVHIPTHPQNLAYGPLNALQPYMVKSRRMNKVTETVKDSTMMILLYLCLGYWFLLIAVALIIAAPFCLVLCIVDWAQGNKLMGAR